MIGGACDAEVSHEDGIVSFFQYKDHHWGWGCIFYVSAVLPDEGKATAPRDIMLPVEAHTTTPSHDAS